MGQIEPTSTFLQRLFQPSGYLIGVCPVQVFTDPPVIFLTPIVPSFSAPPFLRIRGRLPTGKDDHNNKLFLRAWPLRLLVNFLPFRFPYFLVTNTSLLAEDILIINFT